MSSEKTLEPFVKKAVFPHSNAIIKITEDGTAAVLLILAAEIGQGALTVLSQIAAETLGIGYARIRVRAEDSDISPLDLGAYSSRTTLMAGNAVVQASRDVLRKLFSVVSGMWDCQPEDLQAGDDRIFHKQDPSKAMDWAEAARKKRLV